ncbi:MAG TPA: glycine--tRNA ligase subunit beta [Candidatus Acidoferrales bacterium]|nr:glycine--tRNA ligase subunit beta [Candidatus Acidoferrales bacterium]
MSLPFLLEIGTEEIPDWMIPPALENLRALFEEAVGQGFDPVVDATPRRLVLRAKNLPGRQDDEFKTISGPAVTAPEAAVAGFARKHAVSPRELQQEGGRWVFSTLIPGRMMLDVLAEALPGMILKIYFPKTMYWTGKNGPRFIRPIRWMVALLGHEVIPFEIAGVKSGAISAGHRILGAAQVPVTIETYEQKLRENFVIISAGERETRIRAKLDGARDEDLVRTLVYLTEFPAVISGTFEREFLKLPAEVLVTVMKHHQRYFALYENGQLANRFLAVTNTEDDPDGLIRRGNERVLRARFNDARFFWEVDQRKKLEERVADLAHVTFQAQLGSYRQKTERITDLVRDRLQGNAAAVQAAQLCKCDLTTEMVKEFPELQGVVGGLYAREQGEPEEVWQAVYDHYKPVGMEDSIPRNRAGQLVSIADKLDTLVSCFKIDLIPTGSKDPFALRRAAQGVVKILVEGKLRIPLKPLLGGITKLEEFFLDRVRYYFKDVRGFKYDEVNAVLASGWEDLADVEERLLAIQAVRPTENFEPLAASFKRIRNILKQAQFAGNGGRVDVSLLEAGPEADLYGEFLSVRGRAAHQPYQPALESIASLRPKVDLFFDKVLVNAPDPKIRQNRLTLLHTMLAEFSTIADFSEIVTNG